jgi:branched-chain amino acid transport system substrate-binding protein
MSQRESEDFKEADERSAGGKAVSRREFLKLAGLTGATIGLGAGLGGLLAACGGETTTTTTAGATTTTAGATTTTAAGSTTTVSAAAEAGRTIKIGALSPLTGALASFGGPDKWIVSVVETAVKDGVVCGDGKNHPIEILNQDTQSNPDRVAQVTGDLIFNAKVDMVLASSSPDTVNPAAEQCEANGVPLLANFVPWQAFYFGRGATPDTPFKWTWMYHFGLEDAAECRVNAWNQIETNKKVALLFPNDADGVSWSNKETGLGPALEKAGYEIVSQPDMYAAPAEDFTSQITAFKKSGAEIIGGLQVPPDFTNFWKQAYQQGLRPKILNIAKALLFHQTIEAVGDIGVDASDHNVWHPTYPYTSSLTGETCQQFADRYTAETGKQWTEPLGQLGKYEWAIDVLKRVTDIENKELFPPVIAASKFAGINGPVDFTLPVQLGTVRPVPNVYKIKISYGQWIKLPAGSPYPYDLVMVWGQDPAMPIPAKLVPMAYA